MLAQREKKRKAFTFRENSPKDFAEVLQRGEETILEEILLFSLLKKCGEMEKRDLKVLSGYLNEDRIESFLRSMCKGIPSLLVIPHQATL